MEWNFVGARYVVPLRILLGITLLVLTGCTLPVEVPPPARPTVIVVTATGPYSTTFDDPNEYWLSGNTDNSIGGIVDGQYRLTIKQPGIIAWTHQARSFGAGVYEVDATLASGPEASAFGLLLLGSNDLSSLIYVIITGDGRYDIGYCESWCRTQESLIGGLTLSYAILTEGSTNRLRVDLTEGTLNLAVNGAPVSTVQGISGEEGLMGFIGESSQFGAFVAAFDNLQVVEPGTVPPTSTPQPTLTAPALIEPTPPS
jgi:hypothetical protein